MLYKAENEKAILNVFIDENPQDPREWDNLGTMVCWHRRYRLGDKHDFREPEDFFFSLAEDIVGDTDRVEKMTKEQRKQLVMDSVIILPLYIYDHGGVTMNTSGFACPWDSGQVGWIYVTKATLRKEWGIKLVTKKVRERAIKCLMAEVEVYDHYLTGSVYGFKLQKKVYREPCEPHLRCERCNTCPEYELKEVDSCWGFYGSDWKENGLHDHIPSDYAILVDQLQLHY